MHELDFSQLNLKSLLTKVFTYVQDHILQTFLEKILRLKSILYLLSKFLIFMEVQGVPGYYGVLDNEVVIGECFIGAQDYFAKH